jgi:hypothetical protein
LTRNSLKDDTAKILIQSAKTRADKAVIALGAIGVNSTVKNIQVKLTELGEPSAKKWNLSAVLSQSSGRVTRTNLGWELTANGQSELSKVASKYGPQQPLKSSTEVLRKLLPKIKNVQVRAFIEEAIGCVEHDLLKASVVFTWVGAMAVLHDHVVKTNLSAFNADANSRDPKWRPAKDADGLGLMKESDFLDSMVRIGIIGKNVKTELKNCLDLRNGCGHPNSLEIGEAKVLAHIETLVLNVFKKF